MTEQPLSLRATSARDGARVRPRLGCRVMPAIALQILLLLAFVLMFPGLARTEPAPAEPVSADISVNLSSGYARIVLRFSDEIDANVRMANGILVVNFSQPVKVGVDRLDSNAVGYVAAARRDPDGKAIRMALAQKVTVNSMMAGERLFIDLLPETWKGMPPGLPQEVVEELARRAREAERKARQQRALAQQKQVPWAKVRVSHQPTFSRYVFELPELIPIGSERGKDALKLEFDAPLRFDLADVKATLPPTVETIASETGEAQSSVSFAFIGKVDVRSFREDNNYVVDISPIGSKPERVELIPSASPPPSVPAARTTEAAAPQASAPSASARAPEPRPAGAANPPPAPPVAAAPAAPAPAAVPAETPPGAEPVVVEAEQARTPRDPNAAVQVELRRQGDSLKLSFPFAAPTPAAVFRRADALWLVFDTGAKIDLSVLNNDPTRTIRAASITRSQSGQVIRIKLERPRLTSVSADDLAWTVTIGDSVMEPTRPLTITRNVIGTPRATAGIPFDGPHTVHRLSDPDIGDVLQVITGLGPARGFLKPQDFVEFRLLASTHGVVIQPIADDLSTELAADKIVLSRPSGLILSTGAALGGKRTSGFRSQVFDPQLWGFDREATFNDRQGVLIAAAAAAAETKRSQPRLDLARFYLAREMYPEAKAVLDLALSDERPGAEDAPGFVMRAIANIMLDRSEEGFKDLASPQVGMHYNAQLWRAFGLARAGKWAEAREAFRNVEAAIGTLPIELQRTVLKESVRAAIEVHDFEAAAAILHDFETVGVPPELAPSVAVLNGRVAEGLGRNEDALTAYRAAADSSDRPSAAQGRLRETVLRYRLGDLKRSDVISDLETLTTTWRGDETEVEALQLLARLYTEEARYRDAFYVMRTALKAHPNSEMTRRIQEEAATTFNALFLDGKGDALPAVDALSLFYDFRELTPNGRRGDEMIRRLTDRLVSVDLLDQAAELLQHQVDHRLQGAARAQVATRLAVIYLMNRKPDRALATLRATRSSDLSTELRNQRLLLEARCLSDTGRHDVAIEVISNIRGKEAIRLRSDILWAGKRWAESAEQMELLYGERWRDWLPLSEQERADILRAGLGYALGEDRLGLGRFREKYAAKMAESPDRRAFEVVTAPAAASTAEFRDAARTIASVDTLEAFLRDMRARYPETGAFVPATGEGQASQSRVLQPDRTPTGTVPRPRKPAKAAPARTAARADG